MVDCRNAADVTVEGVRVAGDRVFEQVDSGAELLDAVFARAAVGAAKKPRSSDVASLIRRETLQMHGGIGMTDEKEISLFFKRAKTAASMPACSPGTERETMPHRVRSHAMNRLTISFDNGPFPGVTEGVLETLRDFGVRANFFVCGDAVRDPVRRALVERARDAGHSIGNHTLTHSIELGATDDPDAPAREIGLAQEILEGLVDERRLFRPAGGGGVLGPRLLSPAAVAYLESGGYTLVLWNSVPRDWEDPEGWPERALEDMAHQPWTLVVLHDLPTGAMTQLRRFIEEVTRRGTEIVHDLPPDCVPIQRGTVSGDLSGLVRGGWPPRT